MKMLPIAHAAAIAAAFCVSATHAADIVLTPPAAGGVAITNAAGNTTRFRVAEDGTATLNGNLDLPDSAGGVGNITKNGGPFISNPNLSLFVGSGAGNPAVAGTYNLAIGVNALPAISTGISNIAIGRQSQAFLTNGVRNVAVGNFSLFSNVSGTENTAMGFNALGSTSSNLNTAIGFSTMANSNSGSGNTAVGANALEISTGNSNVAIGYTAAQALGSGSGNIVIGTSAGSGMVSGNNNIIIGHGGSTSESSTTRIGSGQTKTYISGIRGVTTTVSNAVAVMIDSDGQLGTVSSSARFKDDIADMDAASDALMQLRPVTFHYKADQDPAGARLQYGLVAEEVAQVYPGLVAQTPDGQAETVMYHYLPPMLLNELQKQRRTIERLEGELAEIRKQLGLKQAAK